MEHGTDPDAPRETTEAEPLASDDRGSDDHDGFDSSDARLATDETTSAREETAGTGAPRPLLDLDPTDAVDATVPDTADATDGPWVDRSVTADDHESDVDPSPTDARDRSTDNRSSGGRSRHAPSDVTARRTNRIGTSERDAGQGVVGRLARALGTGRRVGFADAYDADAHGPLATFEAGGVTERDRATG